VQSDKRVKRLIEIMGKVKIRITVGVVVIVVLLVVIVVLLVVIVEEVRLSRGMIVDRKGSSSNRNKINHSRMTALDSSRHCSK